MKDKKVSETIAEQSYFIMNSHVNGGGHLFGGQLLCWIDELAGVVSRRFAEGDCVTAAIDNMQFRRPADLNDLIVLIGRVTYVGHTSIEVRIDSYVESYEGMRTLISRAFFVMVAVNHDFKPRRVPKLILETGVDKAQWEDGQKRQALRLKRREEGY